MSVGSLSPNWATWDRAVGAFVPWQAAFATSSQGPAGSLMHSAARFTTAIVFGTPLAEMALMATNEKSKQSAQASPRSNSQKSDKSAGSSGGANQREQGSASAKNEKAKSPRKQSNGSSAGR